MFNLNSYSNSSFSLHYYTLYYLFYYLLNTPLYKSNPMISYSS